MDLYQNYIDKKNKILDDQKTGKTERRNKKKERAEWYANAADNIRSRYSDQYRENYDSVKWERSNIIVVPEQTTSEKYRSNYDRIFRSK